MVAVPAIPAAVPLQAQGPCLAMTRRAPELLVLAAEHQPPEPLQAVVLLQAAAHRVTPDFPEAAPAVPAVVHKLAMILSVIWPMAETSQ